MAYISDLVAPMRRAFVQPARAAAELERDGYAVVRGLFGRAAVRQMHAELSKLLSEAKGPLHRYDNGSLAVAQRDEVRGNSPAIADYLTDRAIGDIVKRYLSTFSDLVPIVNEQIELERNLKAGTTKNSGWHFDRTPSVKAAIFLTDTDQSNGAFFVIPGSHKAARRTALKFLERNPDPIFIDNFVKLNDAEKGVRVDVKAGDVVIFDTLLVHKGGELLIDKERAVIRGVTWPPVMDRRYLNGGEGDTFDVYHPYDRTGQKSQNPRHNFVETDPDRLLELGIKEMQEDHQSLRKHADAEKYFRQAISLNPHLASAHLHLGIALQVQTRHVEGIPHFRRALELDPSLIAAHYELAKALHLAGQNDEARFSLEAVLRLDPSNTAARRDLDDLSDVIRQNQRKAIRYPNELTEMADLRSAIRKHVLNRAYPAVLNEDSRVVTFGSCFAGNIATALRKRKIGATNTTFGEFVNSTFANRHYIDWIVDGTTSSVAKAIADYHSGDPNFSGDPAKHRRNLIDADLIVLTVGVAPCFFRRDTGEFVIPRPSEFNLRAILRDCEFRTTSVQENVDNLKRIVAQLRKINPSATIIFSLSPVPLKATFEYESAVVADCVSKSTLRVAIDEMMKSGLVGLVYWPSFEIVRWLGCYSPGMYGAEDASTIHVSEHVVQMIADLFVEDLSGGTLLPAQI